ncbi:unnamed protein product [Spirodela intermedia]|uniref:Uncharacterized protein n=1 Tax=Spirodela intermedia TaxID=51605 RepID=A0A7I8JGJ0_SPIIN|nr:unnamed protein product [Spirodela intermedia]CAA6668653.1 unnamed protein product [Spirodela intermedia]
MIYIYIYIYRSYYQCNGLLSASLNLLIDECISGCEVLLGAAASVGKTFLPSDVVVVDIKEPGPVPVDNSGYGY